MAEYLDADLAVLTPYLEKLGATPHRAQLITLLNWVHTTFPQLKARGALNRSGLKCAVLKIIPFDQPCGPPD
ncbi:hypothetical protein WP50_22575 [Lactiplantibacillus plantarum]|nr:hypothetical protein WP50_22575 [Lactiplantibacillus plantarum]